MRRSFWRAAMVPILFFCLFGLTDHGVFAGAADDVLVFEREGWVWSCDGNGRGLARLARGARPGISPDGRLVAFFRPDQADASGDASDLWVRDLKRGHEARIVASLFAAWRKKNGSAAYLKAWITSTMNTASLALAP